MWPFLKQKKQDSNNLPAAFLEREKKSKPPRRTLTLEQLVDGIGDCSYLTKNNTALKFWLPEPVMQGLKELTVVYDKTCSRYIRDFLLIHCYGIYTFQWLHEQKDNDQYDDLMLDIPMFSRKVEELPPGKVRVTTYFVPELGKNIASMKIWIPLRLKNDLTILAEHVDLTVSNYVREIIISRLLGHGTLPMRPKMLAITPSLAAKNWDEDGDVSWREVSEEESLQHDVVKTESEVVDLKE